MTWFFILKNHIDKYTKTTRANKQVQQSDRVQDQHT